MGSKPGRRKSCAPCRASKARCSLESPCRRCEERNLDCKYDHTPKRSAAYRALRPLPALGEHISGDLNQPDSYVEQLVHNGNTPTGLLMETQDGPIGEASMDWDALLSPSSLHLSSSYELELPELPSPFSTTRLNTPQGPRVIPEPSGLPRLWNHHQSDVLDDQRALLSLGSPKPSHAAKATKYTSYDYKGLLQALQAVLTYLLLQAGDPDSIPENNIMTLLTAPGAIARALCMAYDYTGNLTSSTKVDRQEWVIRESIRRTICIIFGIELLLDVDFSVGGNKCGGYSQVPLPAGRELWETVSNDEWAARYSKLHAQSRNDRVLSIRDLRQARRAIGTTGVETADRGEEGRLVAQVAEWCESLDELGMMVWMAVMLES
ncbi:hypothetical protein CSUB01_04248 [Colletotrichum sublineola]|uniref:Zn(2)-C6 fungal-type domain-containing protein n=1 Tax=Colletotrichum sublineola TaxID=1173701 RepID=A0A066XSJ7_COLSU|nr:hypothetical protein CSUB01_04248 [Colletotrichum sublineola]